MARDHGTAAETLGEIESASDRLSDWLEKNLVLVASAIGALLLAAGIAAWVVSSQNDREEEASSALAQVRADYLSAMGAGPGAIEVPELANPEAAAQIRAEYRARFEEMANEYSGSVAAALAALESAELGVASGATADESVALLERALKDAPSRPALRGLLMQKTAAALEAATRWSDAADHHERAANLGGYPLAVWALADAARCRAAAGDGAAALALYDRLEREHPELKLPEHQRAEHLELRAAVSE